MKYDFDYSHTAYSYWCPWTGDRIIICTGVKPGTKPQQRTAQWWRADPQIPLADHFARLDLTAIPELLPPGQAKLL